MKKVIKLFIFFSVISTFGLTSCGKLVYSPYTTLVKDYQINTASLNKLDARASDFGTNFKVAVLSDTHDYYSELKQQIKYINDRKDEIAFVLHTGDATNLGILVEWETFQSFIEELEVPFIMVIGNHDMLTYGTEIYNQMFGHDLDFSFTFKQTKFIFINNNNWESDGHVPDLDFLESELTSSSSTHHIVLGHVQPDDDVRYTDKEINDMKNLLDTNSVDYFVNGHNHNYGTGSFGTVTRVTAGSSSKNILLILDINNSGVTHQHVTP